MVGRKAQQQGRKSGTNVLNYLAETNNINVLNCFETTLKSQDL